MHLSEYEQFGHDLYRSLAETVRELLEKAFYTDGEYRLQQVQHRAKSINSLKKRLVEEGQEDSQKIEEVRKDLAGCRIVFYTNDDVNRFVTSGILSDMFEVDWERSKFHHPSPDEPMTGSMFQSFNYVVTLKSDRTELIEYKKFAGLVCEIQVQTSLTHAWAEMAHDTIYKKPEIEGFGSSEMSEIKKNLNEVMQNYLLPAGYIFQKIAVDVEHIAEARSYFEQGAIDNILCAENNNERENALKYLTEKILPYYNDIEHLYPELCEKLKQAWLLSEQSAYVPNETPYGTLPGATSDRITEAICGIFEHYRYFNIIETYKILRDLYSNSTNERSKEQLIQLAEKLSTHTTQIWQKHGPLVQVELAKLVSNETDVEPIAPILVMICRQILSSDVTGCTYSSSDVTFHQGTVHFSEPLIQARQQAIQTLLNLHKLNINEDVKWSVISALFEAGSFPIRDELDQYLYKSALFDLSTIVEALSERISSFRYVELQRLEDRLHRLWRRVHSLPDYLQVDSVVQESHREFLKKLLEFKELINLDDEFVIFKTIVDFQTIQAHQWEDVDYDFHRDEEARKRSIRDLVLQINEDNWEVWKQRIIKAGNLKSNDGATFPPFIYFLQLLSEHNPPLALELLKDRDSVPEIVISPIAEALLTSDYSEGLCEVLFSWVRSGNHLRNIILSTAFSDECNMGLILSAKNRAIELTDVSTCTLLIEAAVRNFKRDESFWKDEIFFPSLGLLRESVNAHWVHRAAYFDGENNIYSSLTVGEAEVLLSSIIALEQINFYAERLLKILSKNYPRVIIEWFGKRIHFKQNEAAGLRYDVLPFRFHNLHHCLQQHSSLLLDAIKEWYADESLKSKWDIKRILSKVYPNFEEPLPSILTSKIHSGDTEELEFIASVIAGFEGREALLPIFKNILESESCTDKIVDIVSIRFNETGVMRGEFGTATTSQRKIDSIKPWVKVNSKRVRDFAIKEIKQLEKQVAVDTRRAQEQIALRKLEYGESLDADLNTDK